MRTVRARASSKNSSPCSPPRDSSAERILETGSSESAAATDIGPPRGFTGSEYIIQTVGYLSGGTEANLRQYGGLGPPSFSRPGRGVLRTSGPDQGPAQCPRLRQLSRRISRFPGGEPRRRSRI